MKLCFYDCRWQLLAVIFTWATIGLADVPHAVLPSNEPTIFSNDASSDNEAQETLSSIKLVADILAANPQLEIVQAIWQAANSVTEQASALDDPMVSHSFAPLTIGNQQSGFSQNTVISQKLPWPGKRRLQAEAAAFDAEAAKENVGTLRLLLMATAKTLFADWYYIHQALNVNEINRRLLNEFHGIALNHYATGLASKQDALQAEVEIALLDHQKIALERERRTLLARLNTLLNRLPETPLQPPAKLSTALSLPKPAALQEIALQSRPELKELAARIQASKTRGDLAEKDFYPDFKVSAGYNNFWRQDEQRFIVGVEVNLPLDQDKRQAAEDEARARLKQQEWSRVDRIAKIREQVQIAYELTVESLHVYQLYQDKLLPLADETLKTAMINYRSGDGDFLTLLSSEKNLIQIQLKSERALADMHRHLAELEQAVGSVSPFSAIQLTQGAAL
ncbi:TolC family protein [Methylobacter whittenburyi]|uniref:TolC family protein n=1 Tax=Methylotuvimicrobium sp. KM1 TaxID=3377707 RepID=UPI000689CAF2